MNQDSSDEDLFVLYQYRPIIPLTRENALRVKEEVLNRSYSSNNSIGSDNNNKKIKKNPLDKTKEDIITLEDSAPSDNEFKSVKRQKKNKEKKKKIKKTKECEDKIKRKQKRKLLDVLSGNESHSKKRKSSDSTQQKVKEGTSFETEGNCSRNEKHKTNESVTDRKNKSKEVIETFSTKNNKSLETGSRSFSKDEDEKSSSSRSVDELFSKIRNIHFANKVKETQYTCSEGNVVHGKESITSVDGPCTSASSTKKHKNHTKEEKERKKKKHKSKKHNSKEMTKENENNGKQITYDIYDADTVLDFEGNDFDSDSFRVEKTKSSTENQFKGIVKDTKQDKRNVTIDESTNITQSSEHIKKKKLVVVLKDIFKQKTHTPEVESIIAPMKRIPQEPVMCSTPIKLCPYVAITEYFSPGREIKIEKISIKKSPLKKIKIDQTLMSNNENNEINTTPTKSNQLITKYFSPTSSPEKEITIEKKVFPKEKKSPNKSKKKLKIDQALIDDVEDSEINSMASALCCQIFEQLVHEEIKKQLELQNLAISSDYEYDRLFTDEECSMITTFFDMNDKAKQLYVRMLGRKKTWHRLSSVKYLDISNNLTDAIDTLHKNGFININIENEELKNQMKLLSKPEIQNLCRLFNVKPVVPTMKKEAAISALLHDSKIQKSVADMFNKLKESSHRIKLLKNAVKNTLGPCFQLNKTVTSLFNRIILLFSLFHDVSDETKRYTEQYRMLLDVLKGRVRYIHHKLDPQIVFYKRDDILKYEKSKILQVDFETAILKKDFELFHSLAMEVFQEFKNIMEDKDFRIRVAKLPRFLQRYNAGSVYAHILTKFCETFKKKLNPEEIINILTLMLDQQLFGVGLRGKWYELLTLAYESQKNTDKAAKVIIVAYRDESINEVKKLSLQIKATMLLQRKSNKINDVVREKLDNVSTMIILEPPSIEIKGKAMENIKGSRCVYVQNDESGISYCSVEQQAIFHYKEHGFSEGLHVEGRIVHTIFYMLFFDIIYSEGLPGIFQSPYQTYPLDLFSRQFYENRKQSIDNRLDEMELWTIDVIRKRINEVIDKYSNVQCIISWDDRFSATMFCNVITCLGIPALRAICERLVKDFRTTRSGFPDLTLWNMKTKKCKFVEVKSPNDKLSPNQRLWLNYLRNEGVDCEVCNVRNVAAKKFR